MITRKNFLIGAAATAATASAIEGGSIEGGLGRARGLVGGAFMGALLAQQRGESKPYDAEVEWLQGDGESYVALRFDEAYPQTIATIEYSTEFVFTKPTSQLTVQGRAISTIANPMCLSLNADANTDRLDIAVKSIHNYLTSDLYSSNSVITATARVGSDNNTYSKYALGRETYEKTGAASLVTTFSITGVSFFAFLNLAGRMSNYCDSIRFMSAKINVPTAHFEVDLIPVRKNGLGYFYDRLSGNLYGNDGGGHLLFGPDK